MGEGKKFSRLEAYFINRGLDSLKENGVIVDISVYPPVENKVPQIIETLKRSGVEHNVMPVEQFYKRFSLDGKFDKVEAFKNCLKSDIIT